MKIGIMGTGRVGLPTGVGFAALGHAVVCVDKDIAMLERLQAGKIPWVEAGLEELLRSQMGRMRFTIDAKELCGADVVLLAVPTPSRPGSDASDLSFIRQAVGEVSAAMPCPAVLAIKSTVPVGTGDVLQAKLRRKNSKLAVVSFPEFFCEGTAVRDFFSPSRLVVGVEQEWAREVMDHLLRPFADRCPLLFVSRRTAELVKHASNAFLAMKVHYANEMADLCEKTGASGADVLQAIGLDPRIGNQFLRPGPGYGGSCFPKDCRALAAMGRRWKVPLRLVRATIAGNEARLKAMVRRILSTVQTIPCPRIALLGLAFKGGTADCRESPMLAIAEGLIANGVDITVFDAAADGAKNLSMVRVRHAVDATDAATGADVVVIGTEDFYQLDLGKIRAVVRTAQIVDLRNVLDADRAKCFGFFYLPIGEKPPPNG